VSSDLTYPSPAGTSLWPERPRVIEITHAVLAKLRRMRSAAEPGPAIAAVGAEAPRPWRAAFAVLMGNTLAWFDIAIYGFLAVTMAKVFFPGGSETASVLLALGTFGMTFVTRPLGAIVIGRFADQHGRRAGLALATALTMGGTAMIAFAPTYAMVGLTAPVLVVLARLIQGFASGGEFGSATAFLSEQQPGRRGFFASWQFAAQALAAILATAFGVALNLALSEQQLESWGWRIPFLFGVSMGPLAYSLRAALDETSVFRSMQGRGATPMRQALRNGKTRILTSFGLVVFGTVANYTILFMPTYAIYELGMPAYDGFMGGLVAAMVQVVLIPLAGLLSDRWGRSWIAIAVCIASLIASYPLFAWLVAEPTVERLMLFQVAVSILVALYAGSVAVLMADLFAPHMRTTGVAVSYSLGVAISGGLAPFFNVWLIDLSGSRAAPSWYLMLAAAVSLVALAIARSSRWADEPAPQAAAATR